MSMSGAKIGMRATITNPAQKAWLIQRVQRGVEGRASCAAGGGASTTTAAVPRTATATPRAPSTTISVAVS